jgi:hypothetical protein
MPEELHLLQESIRFWAGGPKFWIISLKFKMNWKFQFTVMLQHKVNMCVAVLWSLPGLSGQMPLEE